MTAQTANRWDKRQVGDVRQYGIEGSATANLFKGSAIVLDTGGYAIAGVNTAGHRFVGVAQEQVHQTATAADGTNTVNVWRRGLFSFVYSGGAITDIGQPVWLTDDQTVSLTQTNVGPIGKIVDFISATECIVDIGDAAAGGAQFASLAYGTGACASGSTTVEVTTGLASVTAAVVSNATVATAPTKVFSSDGAITSSAVTVARQTSGTLETDFEYIFVGY
jgi:hypothetical protein